MSGVNSIFTTIKGSGFLLIRFQLFYAEIKNKELHPDTFIKIFVIPFLYSTFVPNKKMKTKVWTPIFWSRIKVCILLVRGSLVVLHQSFRFLAEFLVISGIFPGPGADFNNVWVRS